MNSSGFDPWDYAGDAIVLVITVTVVYCAFFTDNMQYVLSPSSPHNFFAEVGSWLVGLGMFFFAFLHLLRITEKIKRDQS